MPQGLVNIVGLIASTTGLALMMACSSIIDPLDEVVTALTISPTVVAAGDTVTMLGVAFNPTREAIRPGSGCAPGIGFLVTDPQGVSRSVYDGLAFNCPLLDSQSIEPGEADSVTWRWVAPAVPGRHQIRAGLVTPDGLRSLSAVARVTVQ